jgi:small subunit ribosomal protein S2
MLTNWQTISKSIARLRELDEKLGGQEVQGLTKREQLGLSREQEKLERALGGIKEMGGLPDILFIIDTNKEDIAVAEANKLGIPVVAVIDSNSDPAGITYPIPGNDDAIRAISTYCNLVADSVLDGLSASLTAKGVDIGADENAGEVIPEAEAPAEAPVVEAAAEAAPAEAAAEAPAEAAAEATPETPAEGEETTPAS